jgi:CIC family chloride channel protein
MAAVVLATLTGRALSRDTIYTLKLRRRGIDLDHGQERSALAGRTVGEAMEAPPEPLRTADPVARAAARLAGSAHGVLPVLDNDGEYLGTVRARSVAEALAEHQPATVGEITHHTRPLYPDTELPAALDALIGAHGAGLPVLMADGGAPVGWLTYQAVLMPLRVSGGSRA